MMRTHLIEQVGVNEKRKMETRARRKRKRKVDTD